MSDTSKDIEDIKKHRIKSYRLRLGDLGIPVGNLLLQLPNSSTTSGNCPLQLLQPPDRASNYEVTGPLSQFTL